MGRLHVCKSASNGGLFLERCESLLAFTYCEFFGLKVDLDVAYRNLEEQERELGGLLNKMNTYLATDMPPEYEFSWGSRWDISAALFGGARPYQKKVSYDPIKYEKADFYKIEATGELVPVQDVTEGFEPSPVRSNRERRAGKVRGHR